MKVKSLKFVDIVVKHKLAAIIIGALFLVSIVGITVVLINNKNDYESLKSICIVQFETNGGIEIEEQKIKCGSVAIQPDNPKKEGFVFKYWKYNEEEYDFTSPVLENIILKAYYNNENGVEVVTVSFDTSGGSKIDDIQIKKGTKLTEPLDPTMLGYKFDGWYKDYEIFDFSTIIEENITLKAKWTEKKNSSNVQSTSGLSSSKYKCSGNFRSDVPEKNVMVGYLDHVNWTWSTYGSYGGQSIDDCYITYKSSDSNIAMVNDSGIITTKKAGTVYISECVNDTETKKELVCFKGKLIINNSVPNTNDNSSNTNEDSSNANNNSSILGEENHEKYYACKYEYSNFSPTSTDFDLNLNESFDLERRVNYGNGHSTTSCIRKVFSKNDSIIKVNSGTKIQALSVGNTSVDFCIVDEQTNTKLECITFNVNVIDNRVTNITLDKSSIALVRGNTATLVATLTPSNADKNIIWSSSNSSVAKVDNFGKITAVGKGNAIITATSSDGNKTATCDVTVTNPVLSANASVGISTIVSSNGATRGINVTVNASGGSGTYNYYYIKLYKDGSLISQTSNTSSNSLFATGYTNGIYYAEIEVHDSDDNIYKETSGISIISGF